MNKKRRGQSALEYAMILAIMSMMAIYTISTSEFLKTYIQTVGLKDQSSQVEQRVTNTTTPGTSTAPAPVVLTQPTDP